MNRFSFMRSLPVLSLLALSACAGYWPDVSYMPTGYVTHDITPISTPHGYNRAPEAEAADAHERTANAEAWRNLVGQALPNIQNALDMRRPVAVVPLPAMTPLSSSAANYTRDVLVSKGYLVSLPEEANQFVDVLATPVPEGEQIALTLTVRQGQAAVIANKVTGFIPYQVIESTRLPGFTTHPAAGPKPADPNPFHKVND